MLFLIRHKPLTVSFLTSHNKIVKDAKFRTF